jgi:hypothetical protein
MTSELETVGKCFVIQPFDKGTFDKRYLDVFRPAIEAAGLTPYRVDQDFSVDIPIEQIEKCIGESDACFAEITTDNPNVWYEVGFAVALRKPMCLVCSTERQTRFPFDVQHRNIISYKVESKSDYQRLGDDITHRLRAVLERQQKIDTIATLKPTSQADGLTSHQVAVLALMMAQFDSTGVTAFELKQDMKKAGYTEIATGLAVERLVREDYIATGTARDDHGYPYAIWKLNQKGKEWLLKNEDRMQLRVEFNQDDIPF